MIPDDTAGTVQDQVGCDDERAAGRLLRRMLSRSSDEIANAIDLHNRRWANPVHLSIS